MSGALQACRISPATPKPTPTPTTPTVSTTNTKEQEAKTRKQKRQKNYKTTPKNSQIDQESAQEASRMDPKWSQNGEKGV